MWKYTQIFQDIYEKVYKEYDSASTSHHHAKLILLSHGGIKNCEKQNCQNKYGYYNGFPTNEAVFDKMMKAEATPTFGETVFSSTYVVGNNGTSSDGGLGEREPYYSGATNDKGVHEQPKTTYGFGGDFTVEIYAMTEQEKDEEPPRSI